MTLSVFAKLTEASPDPILGVGCACREDTCEEKVDLSVGAYRDENSKPYVFPVIREAEQRLLSRNLYKEYVPIDGFASLKEATQALVFGADCPAIKEKSIASVQALSGTGGLRLVADFLRLLLPEYRTVMLSRPTWANHRNIFQSTGFVLKDYAYWDATTRGLDFEGMTRDIEAAPAGTLVVLHPCAHNPTGIDPTLKQWKQLLNVFRRNKNLLPLFDMAYQGFASGDLDRDAAPVRLFQSAGLEFFVCQSFAKNMGLYGERVGMLHMVCTTEERAKVVLSNLKPIIRSEYSSPPNWGGRLLEEVLSKPEHVAAWKQQLQQVSARIATLRTALRDGLVARKTPGTWDHITQQIGMFSYTGLTPAQCERMVSKWHVYLLKSGRISLAGINAKNLSYVVEAIDDCVRNA